MTFSIALNILLLMPLQAVESSDTSGLNPNIPYNPKKVITSTCRIGEVLLIEWPHESGTSSGICLLAERGKKKYILSLPPSGMWETT